MHCGSWLVFVFQKIFSRAMLTHIAVVVVTSSIDARSLYIVQLQVSRLDILISQQHVDRMCAGQCIVSSLLPKVSIFAGCSSHHLSFRQTSESTSKKSLVQTTAVPVAAAVTGLIGFRLGLGKKKSWRYSMVLIQFLYPTRQNTLIFYCMGTQRPTFECKYVEYDTFRREQFCKHMFGSQLRQLVTPSDSQQKATRVVFGDSC